MDHIDEFAPDVRRMVEEGLTERQFTPVIQRILAATTEEPSYWNVETDRGPASFEVSSEDDVRRVEPYQASILDSRQVRYLIPDIRRLDAASRRILDHFL